MGRVPGSKCPHADIRDCPLYHGMHEPGPSCFHRNLEEGCAVDHGANYERLLAKLRAHNPKLVAQCEFGAEWRASRAQRNRNMIAAGLH